MPALPDLGSPGTSFLVPSGPIQQCPSWSLSLHQVPPGSTMPSLLPCDNTPPAPSWPRASPRLRVLPAAPLAAHLQSPRPPRGFLWLHPLPPSSPRCRHRLKPLPPSRRSDVLGDPVGLHQDSGCLGEIKPRGRHVTAAAVGFNPFEGCWAAAASNAGDNETIAAARGSCGHKAGTGTRGRGMLRDAGGMAGCPWGGDGGGFFSSRLVLALGLPSC